MKRTIALALACCLSAASALAQDPTEPIRIKVDYLEETEKDLKTLEKTRQQAAVPINAVAFEKEALSPVLAELEKLSGVQFNINWPAMELVGFDEDSLIDYKAEQLPMSTVLRHVLDQVSADAFDDDKLGFACRAGMIEISTLRELKAKSVTRSYDIGPLIREPFRPVGMLFSEDAFRDAVAFHAWLRGERQYPFTDAMLLHVYQEHIAKMNDEIALLAPNGVVGEAEEEEPKGAGGGNGGGGLFGDDDERDWVHESINELIELITDTIGDPDEWLDEESTVTVHNHVLIIKTTRENHAQIQRMLESLLQAEIDKQAAILKDAHVSQWVAQANQLLKKGDVKGAHQLIERSLRVMPDHVPANATKQIIEALLGDAKPAG